MTNKELLFEKWKMHEFKGTDRIYYYIGPEHGRTEYATYKTKEAARAALLMREWIARSLKKQLLTPWKDKEK